MVGSHAGPRFSLTKTDEPVTDTALPFLNPLMELSDFDSDSDKPMKLCSLPHKSGRIRFAVRADYMELANLLDGKRSVEDAIDLFLSQNGRNFSKEWLRRLVYESLLPKGILIQHTEEAQSVSTRRQDKRGFLYIKIPILSSFMVDPMARRLNFLYRREVMTLGVLLFIAMHMFAYSTLVSSKSLNINQMNTLGVLLVMLFSTLASFVHEFGHASAASRFGCKNMTIGWGVYLIYTVFWTDVSDAWKLPRQQRAIVDVGGVYFESLFLFLLLILFLHSGDSLYLFAFVFIDLSVANSFNPFLRMDGYWLMSDLFGIVNLREQQKIWLRNLALRIFGLSKNSELTAIGLTKKAEWSLSIYSVLSAAFFVYIVTVIYFIIVQKVLVTFPETIAIFWHEATQGNDIWQIISALSEITWRGLMVLATCYMFINLIKRLVRIINNIRRYWVQRKQLAGLE